MAWPIRSAFASGGNATPATGVDANQSLRVRYKKSAPNKFLISNGLGKQTPKISFVVRYKISA